MAQTSVRRWNKLDIFGQKAQLFCVDSPKLGSLPPVLRALDTTVPSVSARRRVEDKRLCYNRILVGRGGVILIRRFYIYSHGTGRAITIKSGIGFQTLKLFFPAS